MNRQLKDIPYSDRSVQSFFHGVCVYKYLETKASTSSLRQKGLNISSPNAFKTSCVFIQYHLELGWFAILLTGKKNS